MRVIVTTYLPGVFKGSVKSGERERTICFRKTVIMDLVVSYQMGRDKDDMPSWIHDPKLWRKMTPDDKLKAFIQRFDEGMGVEYSIVD